MQPEEWTLHEAKNKFSAVVDRAQHGVPQLVKKRGVPAAVVISVEEYNAYVAAKQAERPGFSSYLLSMPQDDGDFSEIEAGLRELDL